MSVLDDWDEHVDPVLTPFGDARVNAQGTGYCLVQALFAIPRRKHGLTGSYQAVRRHLQQRFTPVPVQAVHRVETPPRVQAHHE